MKKVTLSFVITLVMIFNCITAYGTGTVYYTYKEQVATYILGESIREQGDFYVNANSGSSGVSEPKPEKTPDSVISDFAYQYVESSNMKHYYSGGSYVIYERRGKIIITGTAAEVGEVSVKFSPIVASWYILNNDCQLKSPIFTIKVIDNHYTVRLNYNGGTGSVLTHDVVYKQPYSYSGSLPIPEREGYKFLGWFTAANNGSQVTDNTIFADKNAIIKKSVVTLYAHWEPIKYDVTYNANAQDVTNLPEAQQKNYGQTLTLSETVPEREGYQFLGWALTADGDAAYQPGATYDINEGLALYAVWEGNQYTVSYNANTEKAVSGLPSDQVKLHGADLTLAAESPTCAGSVFHGWALSAEGEALYQPGDAFTENADTTLYAVWVSPDFVLPAALTTIEDEAFEGGAFRYVRLNDHVSQIGRKAFANCPQLLYIYIPESCTMIDADAFSGDDSVTIIGPENSYAEFFAFKNHIAFIADN